MQILPFEFGANGANASSLSRLFPIIQTLRSDAENSILLDNGDMFQGNPVGDCAAEQSNRAGSPTHPAILALNYARYDAVTLGNHDFNFGLDFLRTVLRSSQPKIVCSNLRLTPSQAPIPQLLPHHIIQKEVRDENGNKHLLRIGLLGTVPQETLIWDNHQLAGKITFTDATQSAKTTLQRLQAAGADIVIAMIHAGIGDPDIAPEPENIAHEIAAIPGIDAVIAGHSHQVFPSEAFSKLDGVDVSQGTVHGTPLTMPGWAASHLGQIDLSLSKESGRWTVKNGRSAVLPCPVGGPEDEEIIALATPALKATKAALRPQIGKTGYPIHSFFAGTPFDNSVALIAQAQSWYLKRLLHGSEYQNTPVLSAASPHRAGDRGGPDAFVYMPPGKITLQDLAGLYVYPNTFHALRINGNELRNWLEHAAILFNTLHPGVAGQSLFNPLVPRYHFEYVLGVTFQVDVSRPPRRAGQNYGRISNIRYDGAPISDDMEFILATSTYRATGSGGYVQPGTANTVTSNGDSVRRIVEQYITQHSPLNLPVRPNWSFAPLSATQAEFTTGPSARDCISELGDINGRFVGVDDDGFGRVRITLG